MLHFQVTAAYKFQMAQKWVKTELTSITNGKNAWFPGYSVGLLLNSTDHLPNLPYFPKWDVLPYLKITYIFLYPNNNGNKENLTPCCSIFMNMTVLLYKYNSKYTQITLLSFYKKKDKNSSNSIKISTLHE